VKPPRTLFLRWPFGHPLGEAGNIPQQVAVIRAAFRCLKEIEEPGTIIDLPYKWKREKYPPVE
jgi:D-proline reductase (dithiol) PrdB